MILRTAHYILNRNKNVIDPVVAKQELGSQLRQHGPEQLRRYNKVASQQKKRHISGPRKKVMFFPYTI